MDSSGRERPFLAARGRGSRRRRKLRKKRFTLQCLYGTLSGSGLPNDAGDHEDCPAVVGIPRWGRGSSRLFRNEIDDEGLVEDGKELFHEGLVVLVWQVSFQSLLVLEGDDEAVGVSLSEIFGTYIGSPLIPRD